MLNDLRSLMGFSRKFVSARVAVAANLMIAAALSGCGTLDPTGEWRGLDRIEAAAAPVRAQPDAAPAAAAVPTMAAPSQTDRPGSRVARETGESVESLYSRAEGHYRARRHDEAHRDFEKLVTRDPRALHAWFRLGNLHHARGDLTGAVHAYRKAVDLAPGNAIEHDSREKALANLAIIGLEQARVALDRMGARQSSEAARGRAEALAPLFEQRQAAVQAELARFSPRATQSMEPARIGRPGDPGGSVFRIESQPPGNSSR